MLLKKYVLMHGDTNILSVIVNTEKCSFVEIENVYSKDHIPLNFTKDNVDIKDKVHQVSEWYFKRSIPAERDGILNTLKMLGITDSKELLWMSSGLSLTDAYWLRPASLYLNWNDINYHNVDFSEDFGKVMFGEIEDIDISLNTPNNTLTGKLRKRWQIINGVRTLFKGSRDPYKQEPYNEHIASRILELFEIEHVDYNVTMFKEEPYSSCTAFTSSDIEFIPACDLITDNVQLDSNKNYIEYINICEYYGITNAKQQIDKMLVFDYLIGNTDRHYGNFGITRNHKTMSEYKIAPVFDSGNSLWFKSRSKFIKNRGIQSRPFYQYHTEQMQMLDTVDIIQYEKLKKVPSIMEDVFNKYNAIDDDRLEQMIISMNERIEDYSRMCNEKNKLPTKTDFVNALRMATTK